MAAANPGDGDAARVVQLVSRSLVVKHALIAFTPTHAQLLRSLYAEESDLIFTRVVAFLQDVPQLLRLKLEVARYASIETLVESHACVAVEHSGCGGGAAEARADSISIVRTTRRDLWDHHRKLFEEASARHWPLLCAVDSELARLSAHLQPSIPISANLTDLLRIPARDTAGGPHLYGSNYMSKYDIESQLVKLDATTSVEIRQTLWNRLKMLLQGLIMAPTCDNAMTDQSASGRRHVGMRSGSNPTGRTQLRAGATGTRAHRMAAGAAEDGGGATAAIARVDDTESTSQESTEANGRDRAGDADGGGVQPEAPGFLRRGVQRVLELLSPQPKRPADSRGARTGHAANRGNDGDAHTPAGLDDGSVDVDGGGSAARSKSAAPDRRKPKTRGASKKGGQGGRAKGVKASAKGRSATEEEDFDSDEAEARCEEMVKDRESLQNLNFDKMKRRELVVYAKFLLRNKGAVHGGKKDLVPQLNAERVRRLATWREEDGEDLPEEREEGRAVFQREQEEEEQPQQADIEKHGAEEAMEGSSPMMNGPVAEAAEVGRDDQDRRSEHMDIGGAEAAGDDMDGGVEAMDEECQEETRHESNGPPGVPVYRPAVYRPEPRLNHQQQSMSDRTFSPDPAFGQGRRAAPVERRMLPDTHRGLTEKEKEELLLTARKTRNKQPKEPAAQPGSTGRAGPPRPESAFGGYVPAPRPGAVGMGDGVVEQHDATPSRNEITRGDEELDFLAQRARDSNAPSFRNMHAIRRERPAVHYDEEIDARDDVQRTRYAVTPFASSRPPTRYPPSSQRDARIRSREEMEGRGDDSEHRAKRRRQVEPSTPRWSDQVASRIKENVRNAHQRTPVVSGRRPYLPATSMRPLLFDDPAVEMSPPTRSEALPEPRTQQTALVSHTAPGMGRGMSAESRLGIEQRSAAKRQRDEAVGEVSQVPNLPEPTTVFGDDGDVAGGGWEDDDAEFRFRAPLPVDEVPDDDGMEYDDEDRGPAREQDFTFTPAQKKRRRRQGEPEKSGQAKQASVGAAPSAAADRMAMPPPPPRSAAPRPPAPAAAPPAGGCGGGGGFDHLRPKGWRCNTCFVTDNPESANICLSCEAPRPGTGGAGAGSGAVTPAAPGVSPAQSKPFATSVPKSTGGSIGSSGFVFGGNKSDAGGSSFRGFASGASGSETRSGSFGATAPSSPPSALTSSAAPSPAQAPSTANLFGSAAARTAPAPAPPKPSKRVAAPTAPATDNTDAAYPGGDFEFVAGQAPPTSTTAAPTPTAAPVPAPAPATSAPVGAATATAPAPATSAAPAAPAPAPTIAPFAFGGAGTGSLFGSGPTASPSTSASASAASGAAPSAQAPFTFGSGDGKTGSGLGGGDGKASAPSFAFPSTGAAFGQVSGATSGAAPSTGGMTQGLFGAPPTSTPSTTASAAPAPSAAPALATTAAAATTTSAPSSTTATTVSVAAPAPATSGLSLFPTTSTTLPATSFPGFGSGASTPAPAPASSSSGAPPTSSFVPFASSTSAAPTTSAPAAAPSTTTTTPSPVFSAPATGFGFGTTMVPGAPAKPATDASKTSTSSGAASATGSTPGTSFSFGTSGAGAAPLSFGLAAGPGATPAAGVVGRSTSGSGMDIAGGASPKQQQQPVGGLTLTAPAPAPAGGLSLSLGSTPAPAPAPAPFAPATFGQTPAPAPGFGFGALGSGSTTGPFAAPAPAPGPTPFSSTPSGGLFGQGGSGGANPFVAGASAPAPVPFGGFGLSTGAGTGSGTPSFTFGSTGPSGPLFGTTPSQPTPSFGVSAPAPTAPVFGAGSGGGGFGGFGGAQGGGAGAGAAQANGGGFSLGAATSQAPAGRKFVKGKRPGRR